ncbi:MAG: hypothetical protein NC489_45025 [Ruminococcus flavefaciens]|nr:hypothetical protein [Ruminococcus flavefaciens]
MLAVKMIEYWDDDRQHAVNKRFSGLDAMAEWIFGQMQVDYTKEENRYALYFPECATPSRIMRISMTPSLYGPTIWIKLIEDDCMGIVFSDGTFTAGQKYCSKTARKWLEKCEERRKHPAFNFAEADPEEEETKAAGVAPAAASIPIDIVKEAAYAIHQAGGCGAEDGYAKGYDGAITVAVDILLKKTGLNIDEVIEYGEMQEEQGGNR